MSEASEIIEKVEPGSGLGKVISTLDGWSLTVSKTTISVLDVVVAIIVLAVTVLLARLAIKLSSWLIGKMTQLDPGQKLLAQKLISIAIWIVALLLAVDSLGIDLTALTVFSGALGLALGFGLQKTFGNLLAGIILLMDKSIKPGDVIAVNDGITNTVGQVKKIGIRAVSVTTRDKKEYLIPNENLMINQVENWSYSSKNVRVRVPILLDLKADVELAEKLMLQAAGEADRVLDLPPPTAWLTDYNPDGIQYEIRIWIDDPEDGLASVKSDVLKRALHLFRENGVPIPSRADRSVALRDNETLQEILAALRERPKGPDKPA